MYQYTKFDIASMFLYFDSYTHKQLQKILYYFYSWYLTVNRSKPADFVFEAWVHGPVDSDIYKEYKCYGWDNIPKNNYSVIDESSKIFKLAEKIVMYYGQYCGDELEELTHIEAPWKMARDGLKEYESSRNVIQDGNIVEFYKSHTLYEKFNHS